MTRLRDGVIKRGYTWSYVVRVLDPQTGLSRPRWVGGFATEEAAKSARDEARLKARRGAYVDRNVITVREYLAEWLTAHSLETKPKTLAGYRWLVDRYVIPRLGQMRMQAVRPSHLSGLYRQLLDGGGRNGRPLSRSTVDSVHAVLRKAFNDAMLSEQIIETNPVLRAKRPRTTRAEVDPIWGPAELARFLAHAKSHRLFAFFHLAAFTGAAGRAAQPLMGGRGPPWPLDCHHRLRIGGRRTADRRDHERRPPTNGEHRSVDRPRAPGASGSPVAGTTRDRVRLAGVGSSIPDGLRRTAVPGNTVAADAEAGRPVQREAPVEPAAAHPTPRPPPRPRDDTAAGWRARPCRRCEARSCGPEHHAAGSMHT